MDQVSVFGLGIIGSIWARHYESDGLLAATWNRTAKPKAPRFTAEAVPAAAAARVLHIVVADPPAVAGLLEKLIPVLTAKHLVIQSSTIDPISAERFALAVRQKGARYLESPFTGSRPAAEERQTVFYLGGEPSERDEAEPFLARLSQVRLPIGTPGQAASLKLAMNLNLAIMMQALSESVTFARRAGIDDETYWNAFAKNAGYSPLAKLKEPKIRAGNFDPQFSVKHMHKDLRLALSESRGDGLPLLAATMSRLGELLARQEGDLDFSALLKLLPAPNRLLKNSLT